MTQKTDKLYQAEKDGTIITGDGAHPRTLTAGWTEGPDGQVTRCAPILQKYLRTTEASGTCLLKGQLEGDGWRWYEVLDSGARIERSPVQAPPKQTGSGGPPRRPRVVAWTDGSGQGSGGMPGGWAFLLQAVDSGGKLESSGAELETTSQRMEITAVLRALERLTVPCEVLIISDSQYVVNGIKEWMHGWARNGWRKSKGSGGGPVANRDLWERMILLCKRHKVTAQWVRGHTGVELNERVDFLAGKARADLEASLPHHPLAPCLPACTCPRAVRAAMAERHMGGKAVH